MVTITISVGATLVEVNDTMDGIIKRVDALLYKGKKKRKKLFDRRLNPFLPGLGAWDTCSGVTGTMAVKPALRIISNRCPAPFSGAELQRASRAAFHALRITTAQVAVDQLLSG
jgi:hypothetical protein